MFSENKRHNYTSILDRDLDGNYELGLESIIFPGSYRFLFLKLSIRFFEPVTTNNYDEWKNAGKDETSNTLTNFTQIFDELTQQAKSSKLIDTDFIKSNFKKLLESENLKCNLTRIFLIQMINRELEKTKITYPKLEKILDNILEQLCKGVKTETVFIYIKPRTNKDNIIETLSQKLEKYSVKILDDIKKISLSIIDFDPEKKFICRWKVQNKQGDYSARPVYYIPK